MTTFEDMNQIMKANGWEQILKKSEYEKIKRKNKQITARIGWTYFKLKEECKKEISYTYRLAGSSKIHKQVIGNCGDKTLNSYGDVIKILLCSECRRNNENR